MSINLMDNVKFWFGCNPGWHFTGDIKKGVMEMVKCPDVDASRVAMRIQHCIYRLETNGIVERGGSNPHMRKWRLKNERG